MSDDDEYVELMPDGSNRPLTAEEVANFVYWHVEKTDRDACNCSHAGMERVWHASRCPAVTGRYPMPDPRLWL